MSEEADSDRIPQCPVCRKTFEARDLRQTRRNRSGKLRFGQNEHPTRADFQPSTKIKALVSQLEEIQVQDPHYKALVFSQFTSMLSLVEPVLAEHGITYLRFDGTMNQAQRASVLDTFTRDRKTHVLLISLKAGGTGLNLTAANHVILLDQWWNEAIENQAIDRVHRLGQTRPVFVTRYVIKNTIEKRVLKIREFSPHSRLEL